MRPQLFNRQVQLLALLDSLGGKATNTDFQKLLFLYCQEATESPPYEFVPYRFGAFSFSSYADRRRLIERGLLYQDDEHWHLTDTGRYSVSRSAKRPNVSSFATRYRDLRGDALVRETYLKFPYFATRSEIADRVLAGDTKALKRVHEAKPHPTLAAVITIGYEGRSLENYLNSLIGAGVTLLCDVRRNPISRKYGFSKGTLANVCHGVGIRYEHLPELGIASDRRQSLTTQADYDALFADYKRRDLPKQTAALERVRQWIDAGEKVALTCYEEQPRQCHRHCVSEAIEYRFGQDYAARNL